MGFSLVVLGGRSGGVPLGTSVLVEGPAGRRLLDCGNGALSALDRLGAGLAVEDVLLTHLHADHVQDLYPLALLARYTGKTVPVRGPAGARDLLARWFPLFTASPEAMLAAVPVDEVPPGEVRTAAGVEATPFRVEHNVPEAFGWTLRDPETGARAVVSGDTRPCAALEEASRGADLLLCEATFAGEGAEASRAHHMTAAQAGALARRAGARRLVLTHLLVTTDPERARREAEAAYGGAVEVARPGARFAVG